ncbi:MAG: Uncharacterized protein LiPW30_319 [Parcubacteria group bacterium LiPW_30]|nr:MAG: Uncharacterized protein LiPW30_319 [Parcubacteria group bacterium LiPW_30]
MKQKLINRIPKSYRIIPERGFTIIELLVVIGIIGLLSSVTLANYRDVSARISLENLVQQMAIIVRQAQVYGISVAKTKNVVSEYPPYGVHFNTSPATSFILFVDNDGSGQYSGQSEDVEIINLKNNNVISGLSGNKISSSCLNILPLGTLDIIFTRPNPEAVFYAISGESQAYPSDVEITVKSPDGLYREVSVWSTGQISVGNEACPS